LNPKLFLNDDIIEQKPKVKDKLIRQHSRGNRKESDIGDVLADHSKSDQADTMLFHRTEIPLA
jgi:hypothetical protein